MPKVLDFTEKKVVNSVYSYLLKKKRAGEKFLPLENITKLASELTGKFQTYGQMSL